MWLIRPHRAVGGVDGLVRLPSLRVNELSVNEQLVGHLYGHVVGVLLHLTGLNRDPGSKHALFFPGGANSQEVASGSISSRSPQPVPPPRPPLAASARTSG